METLLDIRRLAVRLDAREGTVRAVNGIDLQLRARHTLGLVGESGCGKSMTAKAVLQILPPKASIASGAIVLASRRAGESPTDIARLRANSSAMRRIRGGEIALIFQEPMSALSPVHTVGSQIAETVRLHRQVSKQEARDRAVQMLGCAGVPHPEQRLDQYPHELSGGLRQRAMIAMALCCQPRVLIADEPTTALDVTVQAQILALIRRLQQELGMATLLITHDMGAVAQMADEVAVMYAGRIVERAPVAAIFERPQHPYTQGLIASMPRLDRPRAARLAAIPGHVPGPFDTVSGCPFHPRCGGCARENCVAGPPPDLLEIAPNHFVACHRCAEGAS